MYLYNRQYKNIYTICTNNGEQREKGATLLSVPSFLRMENDETMV